MDKAQAFNRLPTEDQAWLRQMADAFGKPTAVCIRFQDGQRFDSGRFMASQDYPDFKSPTPLWQRRRSR